MISETTRYYMSKRRALLGTILLLGLIALELFLISSPFPRNTGSKQAIAFVGMVVPTFALFVVVLSSLIARGPAIELSNSGLRWNVSLIVRGQASWQEIESVSCVQMGGSWFVNLQLTDLEAFIARQPLLTRAIHRLMVKHRWPISPASVPGTGVVGTSAEKLAKVLRKHLKAASNNSFKRDALKRAP